MGQSPGLLQEIASGGELSRIMLALKTLLSKKDFVPILIFDEIDVNLGGQTAHKVAQKLKEVSKNHQIIVVTHLAQIAAYADHHYCVEKVESAKKVKTHVRHLPQEDRPIEIARMLGSDHTSKVALTHAQELLDVGQK
jgi:DNA repair protein RecN (Recombination protein N)